MTIPPEPRRATLAFTGDVDRVRATMKDTTSRVLLAAGKISEPQPAGGVALTDTAASERESYGV